MDKATRKIDLTTVSRRCQPSALRKSCPFEISHRSQEPAKTKGRNLEKGQKSANFGSGGPFQKDPIAEFSHFGSRQPPTKPAQKIEAKGGPLPAFFVTAGA